MTKGMYVNSGRLKQVMSEIETKIYIPAEKDWDALEQIISKALDETWKSAHSTGWLDGHEDSW